MKTTTVKSKHKWRSLMTKVRFSASAFSLFACAVHALGMLRACAPWNCQFHVFLRSQVPPLLQNYSPTNAPPPLGILSFSGGVRNDPCPRYTEYVSKSVLGAGDKTTAIYPFMKIHRVYIRAKCVSVFILFILGSRLHLSV